MKRLILLIITLSYGFFGVVGAAPISEDQQQVIRSGILYFNTQAESVCSSAGTVNGSIDRFLQVLAYQESRGNPTVEAGTNSDSLTASGKYQYIDSTWRTRASIYGPSGQYARAKLAPEAVQDAVAYIEYTQKFRDLNSDIFKLAVSHYLPVALTDSAQLDVIPGRGNTLTPRQYANRMIENISQGIGSDIQLHYQDAPDFPVWLDRVGGAAPTVNGSANASGGCSSSATGATIVQIAQTELAAGAHESDRSNLKYGGSAGVAWCAYFVSWVFNEAGKPFEGGTIPAVSGILSYAQEHNYFHANGEPGFVPQPGDVVIYKEGLSPYPSHVNIVISYNNEDNQITTIGGNEGDSVRQRSWNANMPAITGYMRVP